MKINFKHLAVIFFQTASVLIALPLHSEELPPDKTNIIKVSNIKELNFAINTANSKQQKFTIKLADGVYALSKTLKIETDNLTLLGDPDAPSDVIIEGDEMSPTANIGNLIKVEGKHFILDGITLRQSGFHLIHIAGERGAQSPTLKNCVLIDSYQQLVKVTYGKTDKNKVSNGRIENCLFTYTAGIGPNWYIGGLDAHGAKNWIVINNVFENIASPRQQEAEHAIHLWNGSENNIVRNNKIINCDRGIGFGMGSKGNLAGIIENNFIYHSNNDHPFADTGIILESSPNTIVKDNIVILEHSYPNAIEYRFSNSRDIRMQSNKTNKLITKRNSGHAMLIDNVMLPAEDLIKLALQLELL